MEKLKFGRTGHLSTRLLFGAAAFYNTTDPDIVKKTMDIITEAGINHIDTAKSYGESQKMLGPWLKHNRKDIFLATKTELRTYKEAKEDIQRSLDLLQVDSVDLWQMHCLAEPEEWEIARDRENGVLRAFIEAKDEGLVKNIGVTSHGMKAAGIMNQCIEEYNFDSVLTPCNYIVLGDKTYSDDFIKLKENCKNKNVALQIIKTICKGPWPEGTEPKLNTWYEPFTNPEDIEIAIGWALKQEGAFINSAAEISLLPLVIKAVEKARDITEEEMADLAKRTGMSNLFV